MYTVMEKLHNGKTVPTLTTLKDKQAHAAFKRPIAPAFAVTNLTQFESAIERNIRQLILRLDQEFASTGRICSIDQWLQYFTLDVIGAMTFSRSFSLLKDGRDTDDLLSLINSEFSYITIVAQMPWLDRLLRKNPLSAFFRSNRSNRLAVQAYRLLQSRLTSDKPEQGDIVSHLLTYQRTHPAKLSPLDLFGHVMTNVVVGSDSTSVALRACIYFLCRHPHTMLKLREELDNTNGDDSHPAISSASRILIPWATAQKLPYLDAVINESLRLHPPGSILSERVVPATGLHVSGIDIPPGTIVGMSGWLTQRDVSIFGADAESFRPERWLRVEKESELSWETRVLAMKRAMLGAEQGILVPPTWLYAAQVLVFPLQK
ncbi:MAG: hypothetical protein Q9181_001247 [Wetmoreana brouardii]